MIGGAFVAGAGGQVSQRADQVGQAAWGVVPLGYHLTFQVLVLVADVVGDGFFEGGIAAQVKKVVVCQIFEFDLVWSALQTGSVCRGNNRVCQLPDLPTGSLKAPSP